LKGADKPLFFEKIFSFLHLPYLIGSILVALLFGPIGAILIGYIQTRTLDEAISQTFCIYLGENIDRIQGSTILILLSCLLFYTLYTTRYMRKKLMASEDSIKPLLVNEGSYDEVFSRVTSIAPPIIFSLVLLIPFLYRSFNLFASFCGTIISLSYFILSYSLWFLIFCTFIWVYFSSIIGLHFLGKKFLRLKPYYEDRMLGVKPIGSLALNFAVTYYGGLSFLIIILLVTITRIDLVFASVLSIFLVLGIIFFFIPLITTHNKMVEAKRQEQENIRNKLLNSKNETQRAGEGGSELEIRDAINKLTNVLTVDMTKDEVAAIPTWPIDVSIMTRLAMTILAPVIASVLAQYIFARVRAAIGF
jgi:hypothetical protein